MTNKAYHIIKDPVHGSMQFTDEENNWIKPFIDSQNFQRLRHIKQLGLGDLVFPGAVHTRFNHALGCCYIASQIANKLNLTTSQRRTVMIAGLLHDIGHGPFSHAFEGIFYQKSIKHEDWTPFFLKDYLTEDFVNEFNQVNEAQPLTQDELETISNLIMHREKRQKLLADIVSSQLDADRLDYLRRDSHFCGVTYGEYDFRWLLHCLAVVTDDTGVDRLGVTEKGIGVVEQYLMARRLMMRNIYHNGKKYAAEYLLTLFLHYLAQAIWEEDLFPELKDKNLGRFLQTVVKFNQEAKQTDNLEALTQPYLETNYTLYKHLCDYDMFSMIRYLAGLTQGHPAIAIAQRLQSRKLPKIIPVDNKEIEVTGERIKQFKQDNHLKDWQIAIVELPHQSYQGSQDPILVINKLGQIKKLHERSLVISGLSDKQESTHLAFIDTQSVDVNAIKTLFA